MSATTAVLTRGQGWEFALQQFDAWGPKPTRWKPRQVRRRLKATDATWKSWSGLHQRYEEPLRELVHHSGVVLLGLTYVEAGRSSQPPRRACLRGSAADVPGITAALGYATSMTLQGLFVAVCPDEAGRFFAFLARAAATQLGRGVDLQIMFGIGGERDLPERELGHLSGWRGSGPVRAGNDAWAQRQLDVYGSLLDAAYTLREQLSNLEQTR